MPDLRVLALGLLLFQPALAEPQASTTDEVVAPQQPEPPERLDVGELLRPFATDRGLRGASISMEIVDVQSGDVVFSKGADKALIPASTMKVLTAAVALRTLGPGYRFTTDVYADGPIDAAGVLRGNLYIKGQGDPSLVVERLWKLMQELKHEGIQEIRGDVVFDDSAFDRKPQMPGWTKEKDLREGPSYFATSSALSLNFNTVTFVVGPGSEVGGAARVMLDTPAGGYITVESEVVTGPSGSRRWLSLDREVQPTSMTFKLEGSVPSQDPVVRYYRSVSDPTAHFIAVWRELESGHGLKVKGKHRVGEVLPGAKLLRQHRSPLLTTILMDMNKYSNNFIAEQVLKAVGAESSGGPGSVAAGIEVVRAYLNEIEAKDPSLRLINGSGLSREGRLTANALNKVMIDMARHPTLSSEFAATLALAGWDGTLWSRIREDPGKVRGKTGTIDGVHGLTGYVTGSDGRLYAFSFLANDLRGGSGPVRRWHDRLLRLMIEESE